jgi:hypothetical protein
MHGVKYLDTASSSEEAEAKNQQDENQKDDETPVAKASTVCHQECLPSHITTTYYELTQKKVPSNLLMFGFLQYLISKFFCFFLLLECPWTSLIGLV